MKKDFSKHFRFLKLEFFPLQHSKCEGSWHQGKIADHVQLSQIATICREGIFSYNSHTTVTDFEQRLQNEFGLPVQVFRKAGELWIETTQTDKLSLEEQNSMGQASCTPLRFNIYSLFL
ncbi:MAG: hypothetical protein EON98_00170 [Chitinophagaceae bacterium]|nr:MAG: hypothetical protein EON98_00170 [Chitinophagaceae bacterium]